MSSFPTSLRFDVGRNREFLETRSLHVSTMVGLSGPSHTDPRVQGSGKGHSSSSHPLGVPSVTLVKRYSVDVTRPPRYHQGLVTCGKTRTPVVLTLHDSSFLPSDEEGDSRNRVPSRASRTGLLNLSRPHRSDRRVRSPRIRRSAARPLRTSDRDELGYLNRGKNPHRLPRTVGGNVLDVDDQGHKGP